MKKYHQFAASGNCGDPEYYVYGTADEHKAAYYSNEFSGIMNGEEFWENLRAFAKQKNAYVYLMY